MRLILSGVAAAALAGGMVFLWSGAADAAKPECQMMTMQSSSGPREVMMCKDDAGRWYEAGQPAAQTASPAQGGLPDRARMEYQGDYDISVSTPQKMKRNASILDIANALGGNAKKMQGSVKFSLTREGSSLSGTIEASGANPPRNTVTGTMMGGNCKLYTKEVLYEGRCDASGFSGKMASTGSGKETVKGSFQTGALKIVDIAIEQQQQAEAAKVAAVSAQKAQAKAAQDFALMKSRAEAGNVEGMVELGEAYRRGSDGAPQNMTEAAKWLERAAAKGSIWGAYKAGAFYAGGFGVMEDNAKSHRFYLQCAKSPKPVYNEDKENIVTGCMQSVADNFYRGVGTIRNENEGARWYQSCARLGNNDCIDWLNEHGVGM